MSRITAGSPYASALDNPRVTQLLSKRALPPTYRDDLLAHIVPVLPAVSRRHDAIERPLLMGLNGSQGSGKSTLAQFLKALLEIGSGLRTIVLSLDDFYLSRAQRADLANTVHPLLKTRGVPGTHDVGLAHKTLDALTDPGCDAPVPLPAFDKAADDLRPVNQWPVERPLPDVVILEGWCVGCPEQPPEALLPAVNDLESTADPDCVWRRFVNRCLADSYQKLFSRMDILMMLQVPGFHCVFEWRQQQERQLADKVTQPTGSGRSDQIMGTEALRAFISHFQRLTEHQLHVLPARSDILIEVDDTHRWISHICRLRG